MRGPGVSFSFGIPQRAEPVSTAPVPLSHKTKPTQRRAEFAGATVAAPAPTSCGLHGQVKRGSLKLAKAYGVGSAPFSGSSRP
jgi:hypothetical protein